MNILSLGAGVQSSTVLLMSCRGILPKLDGAIFADTQWEPKAVYRWLDDVLEPEAAKAGIPIYRVSKGDIRADALSGGRWASMPLYTLNPTDASIGMIRRQCTKEYKIEPITKKLRELSGGKRVTQWFGISGDEMRRMRMSKVRWIEHYYPLVFGMERPWHRRNCLDWLESNGFPRAPRSACIGCPYHSDEEWRRLTPDEFSDAVDFDRRIRFTGKMDSARYLHRSFIPLERADLQSLEEKGQQNWINECEGMCGV